MRPVYFYGAMSLDGYLADDHDDLQWLFDTDLGGKSTYPEFEACIDTLVMGRATYDATLSMLGDEPFYPGIRKVVFTHTERESQPETEFVSGDVVSIVKKLQQQSGSGIWIVGGGQLVATLLEAGLFSEMWVQIAPVLLGHGKRLFPEGDYSQRLQFIDHTQMSELNELHFKLN
nr:dihydrofolate reductase family protein [Lacticaseibacillus porcinae]